MKITKLLEQLQLKDITVSRLHKTILNVNKYYPNVVVPNIPIIINGHDTQYDLLKPNYKGGITLVDIFEAVSEISHKDMIGMTDKTKFTLNDSGKIVTLKLEHLVEARDSAINLLTKLYKTYDEIRDVLQRIDIDEETVLFKESVKLLDHPKYVRMVEHVVTSNRLLYLEQYNRTILKTLNEML